MSSKDCGSSDQYDVINIFGPVCDFGSGCDACWAKYAKRYSGQAEAVAKIERGILPHDKWNCPGCANHD